MTMRRHRGAHRAAFPLALIAALFAAACGSSDSAARSYDVDGGAGWKYRITITTDGPEPVGSPGGCYPATSPGRTNQQFTVTIDNLVADRDAPLPDFVFGANLSDDGTRVLNVTTVENAFGLVEAFRSGDHIDCNLAAFVTAHGATIDAGGKLSFLVTVAAIGDPRPQGMALLTRVFTPDGAAHDLTTPAA